jgi:hypothetical protein
LQNKNLNLQSKLKRSVMRKKYKNFALAFNSLFSGGDYLRYVTDGKMSRDSVGTYQGPLNDKINMGNDIRNIYSDMNKAIKAGYGKITAQ